MNILKKVTEQTGVDQDTVKLVYYGLVKALVREIRNNGIARFPDIGDFRITEYKARTIGMVKTGVRKQLPPTKVLKFKTCAKLRDYIKLMD